MIQSKIDDRNFEICIGYTENNETVASLQTHNGSKDGVQFFSLSSAIHVLDYCFGIMFITFMISAIRGRIDNFIF